ncbi:MAG: outer membrane beta-barrel protein [Verrucomicrobia bacterium]|nr:outer membrane beta-barrel protein [Verrucomicrobiota bacterium]
MKKQIAIASAILAASSYSFAEIALTESLSVEGFVDMSYTDSDAGNAGFGIDQVEFDFLFSAGAVSAQVDVEYEGGTTGNNGTGVEQAFITYDLGNGGAITAGRFASQLGFEDFEPTGLYQYSNAVSTRFLPGYDQGVKYTTGNLGVAIVDQGGDGQIGDDGEDSDYAIEVAYSTELSEGLNGFIGARMTKEDGEEDVRIINAYVTYETGAWLFAGEIVDVDAGTDGEATDYQVMANYSYSDTAAVTVRYAVATDDDGDAQTAEGTAITLAHNLALADNLALVAEVSQLNPAGAGDNVLTSAVELLFTF